MKTHTHIYTYTNNDSSLLFEENETITLNNKNVCDINVARLQRKGIPSPITYKEPRRGTNEMDLTNENHVILQGIVAIVVPDKLNKTNKQTQSRTSGSFYLAVVEPSSDRLRLLSDSWTDAVFSGLGVDERVFGSGVARRDSWANSPISLQGTSLVLFCSTMQRSAARGWRN